jgi:tetratricopeptide (TPR) repeat protein
MRFARPISSDGASRNNREKFSPWIVSLCLAAAIAVLLAGLYHSVLGAGYLTAEDQRASEQARRDDWQAFNQGAEFARRMTHAMLGNSGAAPLTRLSYIGDIHLARDPLAQPFISHLNNLVLHFCNAMLLFLVMRRLGAGQTASIVAAVVFAVHPIHVAAIAAVAKRGLLLGTFFGLLMILAHLRNAARPRAIWREAVLLCYVAACLSDPLFIVLPVFLLLLDYWPLNRMSRRGVAEKWPLYFMMLVGLYAILSRSGSGEFLGRFAATKDVASNLAAMVTRLLFPVRLSPFYPEAAISHQGIIIAICVAMAGLLAWSVFRSRPLFVALGGMCLFLIPNLLRAPNEGLLGDVWLYPVLLAPLMVVTLAASHWATHRNGWRFGSLLATTVAILLATQTYLYALVWDNSSDLYRYALVRYPAWEGGYVGLVEASIAEYDLDSALHYAEKAVDVAPNQPMTQFYLGTVLLLHQNGRATMAIAPLRRAMQARPDWPECLQNLGVALARGGKFDQAAGYLEKARDLSPRVSGSRVALGNVYLQLSRFSSARAEFQEALKYRQDWIVHLGLAKAWAGLEMPELAQRHLAIAVAKEPASAAHAGAFPQLRRYAHLPGFEKLIAEHASPLDIGENAGFPAASGAQSSKGGTR